MAFLNFNFDNPDAPEFDSILGLGNKKKKAEKKIRKAEKALASGNIKKAEKKLGKAIKKTGQTGEGTREALGEKIMQTQIKVNTQKDKVNDLNTTFNNTVSNVQPSGTMTAFDNLPSPSSTPMTSELPAYQSPPLVEPNQMLSGGGGGGGLDFGNDAQYQQQFQEEQEAGNETRNEPQQGEAKKSNSLLIIVVLAVVGFFIYKQYKK